MTGKSAFTIVPPSPRVQGVHDEWGLFDPSEAGLKAVDDLFLAPAAAPKASVLPATPDLPDHECATGRGRVASHELPPDDGVYDLTESAPSRRRARPSGRGAIYTLEFPTRCPQCCTEISVVRVSRLLRTQVSFTSTLPRKGYIIVCPECDGILSAELSGLL